MKCEDAVLWEDIDPQSGICRYCVERAEFVRTNELAKKDARRALQEIIGQNRPERINAPHISELWASVIEEIGGIGKAAQWMVEDYLDCREREPGGAKALKFWECITRMARDSSTLRESAPDAGMLTDDQLAAEMMTIMEQVARRNRLEYAKETLVEALIEDHHAGRQAETESGADSS